MKPPDNYLCTDCSLFSLDVFRKSRTGTLPGRGYYSEPCRENGQITFLSCSCKVWLSASVVCGMGEVGVGRGVGGAPTFSSTRLLNYCLSFLRYGFREIHTFYCQPYLAGTFCWILGGKKELNSIPENASYPLNIVSCSRPSIHLFISLLKEMQQDF